MVKMIDGIMPLKQPARAEPKTDDHIVGLPNKGGRPRVYKDGVQTTVMMEREDLDYIRALGDDNVSLGIRILVARCKSNVMKRAPVDDGT